MAEHLREASPQPENHVPRLSLKPLREMDTCVSQLKRTLGSHAEAEREQLRFFADLPSREQLDTELRRIEHELTDAHAKEQRAIREVEDTRLAMTFHQLRVRLNSIEKDLVALREAPTIRRDEKEPDAELLATDDKLRRCRERLEQIRVQQTEDRETIQGDERRAKIRRLFPRVEAVLLQEKFIATEEQSIEQLADTIRDLEARIETDRVEAESKAAELATESERAAQSLGDIDRLGAQFKEARRRYRLAQAPSNREPRAESTTTIKPRSEPKAILDAENTVRQLRERIGVERTLMDLIASRDELNEQLRRLYGQHLPPLPMLMMLGIPFALGAAMILSGYYRYDPANLQLMGLGTLMVILASMIKLGTDNVNGDQLFQIRNQLTEINHDLEDAEAFRSEFDREWSDTVRPWRDQLGYAERQLALLRGEVESSNQHDSVEDEYDDDVRPKESTDARVRKRRIHEVRQRYLDASHRWEELLAEIGLPTNLTPPAARLAVEQKVIEAQSASHVQSSALEFQLRQLRNDLDRRRQGLAEIMGQSRQIVQDLGYSLNGTSSGEQMDILRETLHEYRETEQDYAELRNRLRDLESREERLLVYSRQLQSHRRALQQAFDKRIEAERTKQQVRAERAKLLERERDQLLQQIEAMSLRDSDDAAIMALSELSTEQLESRTSDLRNRQNDMQTIVVNLVDRRARVHERLKQIDDLEKLTAHNAMWNDVLATAQDLSHRWKSASREQQQQTKAIASQLRQSENYKYLELAAENCSLVCDYSVDLSFDEQGAFRVLNKSGKWQMLRRLNPHRLGQLYVSLWLARIQEFSDRGIKMPIVMDDTLSLVPRGRKRLAMLLRDFSARGHQLLLITSNQKSAEVFAELEVPIADLADRETVLTRDASGLDEPSKDDLGLGEAYISD